MRGIVFLACAALALAGCDQANMYSQGKSATWDRSDFLKKHMSMQAPVPGTVARDTPNQPVPAPKVITAALVARGHEQYDIFCSPCHGLAGNADGMIVQRGFPKPPPFTSDSLMKAKAQLFYDTISNGKGDMYGFAYTVPPTDRWAIVAYVRALQVSQKPVVADLSPDDKAKLDGGAK